MESPGLVFGVWLCSAMEGLRSLSPCDLVDWELVVVVVIMAGFLW